MTEPQGGLASILQRMNPQQILELLKGSPFQPASGSVNPMGTHMGMSEEMAGGLGGPQAPPSLPPPMMAGGLGAPPPPPVPSPFEPQVTDSQMPGPPLADATAPTLNDQDPAAMAQLAEQMGGEFLPPQATDSQMQPPPVAPPMPPQVASPFMPEPSPPLGAVPDFSGPAPQQDLGAMASMQAGPFASGAQEPALPPMMAQHSPFDDSRSIESYFSDQSLAKRLQDAQRYARSDALLGAGAAMLGANDLQSGLGAAGEAIRGPRAELQRKREELPGQYELARFGMEGERQKRGYAATAEERAIAAEGRAVTEEGREATRFEWEKAKGEFDAARYGPGGSAEMMEKFGLEIAGLGPEEARLRMDEIRKKIEIEDALLPGRKKLQESQAAQDYASADYSRAAGAAAGQRKQPGQVDSADEARRLAIIAKEDVSGHPRGQSLVVGALLGLEPEFADVVEMLQQGMTPEEITATAPGSENDPDLREIFAYWAEQRGPGMEAIRNPPPEPEKKGWFQ